MAAKPRSRFSKKSRGSHKKQSRIARNPDRDLQGRREATSAAEHFGAREVVFRKAIVKMPKKRRTREHIIADLSVNYVERYILSCGYSVERVQKDYGYDLLIFTYDDRGEIENGQIYVQLKATDSLRILADGATIALTLARSDPGQTHTNSGLTEESRSQRFLGSRSAG